MSAIYKQGALLVACCVLTLGFSTRCGMIQNQDTSMHVEIDVYSGRPNPQFDLSEPFSAELGHMLRDLPLANRTEPQPGLGYRGFVVTAETAAALPVKLRVFDGLIIIDDGQQVKVYLDRDGVESRLKRYARQAGYGALVN